ncbi:MAG: hypothetical protein LBO72_10115 [Helicobacteraceae bacterium]|jgi:hypothetical protein|nr:hypothetical protein [Helicobacteraceae bacterium]
MISTSEGRGWLVILPFLTGCGIGIIGDHIKVGESDYSALGMGIGMFVGAIILWFLDRGRKKPPPNLTDTDHTPKETFRDTRFWIPIRYWALAWIAGAILCFVYSAQG